MTFEKGLLEGRHSGHMPPDSRAPLTEIVRCGKDCYASRMYELKCDGFQYFSNALSASDLAAIEKALSGQRSKAAGTRLFGLEALVQPLSIQGSVGRVAALVLGTGARPVRAVLFDKNDATNWALGWHQDRTIVVRKKINVEGFANWTVKAGLQHVAPPMEVLSAMLTLRLHLDAVPFNNAPLLVARGSHLHGRIAETEVISRVERSEIVSCEAMAGDIWAYNTPILHASEKSHQPYRRRVLQVDYAVSDLPGGLQWLGIA